MAKKSRNQNSSDKNKGELSLDQLDSVAGGAGDLKIDAGNAQLMTDLQLTQPNALQPHAQTTPGVQSDINTGTTVGTTAGGTSTGWEATAVAQTGVRANEQLSPGINWTGQAGADVDASFYAGVGIKGQAGGHAIASSSLDVGGGVTANSLARADGDVYLKIGAGVGAGIEGGVRASQNLVHENNTDIGGGANLHNTTLVEAGVKAEAGAHAKLSPLDGNLTVGANAFAGAYTQIGETVTIEGHGVGGTIGASAITPGSAGIGFTPLVGVQDGKFNLGLHGALAVGLGGATFDANLSVDTAHFVTAGMAVKDGAVDPAIHGAVDLGKTIGAGAIDVAHTGVAGAVGVGNTIAQGTVGVGNTIAHGTVGLGNTIADGTVGVGNTIAHGTVGVANTVADGTIGVGNTIAQGTIGLGNTIAHGTIGLGNTIADGTVGLGNTIAHGVTDGAHAVANTATGLGNAALHGSVDAIHAAANAATDAANAAAHAASEAKNAAEKAATEAAAQAKHAAEEAAAQAKAAAQHAAEQAAAAAKAAAERIAAEAAAAKAAMERHAAEVAAAAKAAAEKAAADLKAAQEAMAREAARIAAEIKAAEEAARRELDRIAQETARKAEEAARTVGSGLQSAGNAVVEFFCHVAGTPIAMADGTYKPVEQLKMGDEVLLGGQVIGRGEVMAADLYSYRGTVLNGRHAVFEDGRWTRVEESPLARLLDVPPAVVYPVVTENHLLVCEQYICADVAEMDKDIGAEGRLAKLNEDTERNLALGKAEKLYGLSQRRAA